jgi:hypothetical protein
VSIGFLVLTALLFLGIIGGIGGIILENREGPSSPWRSAAARDALFPILGWTSLVALHLVVLAIGDENLNLRVKHLLGTLAVLPFYYAILATLRLIYRSARRVVARFTSSAASIRWRPIPFLSRLAFPTLFVSAVLATATVYWYDGLTFNFTVIAGVTVLLALIPRRVLEHASTQP